MMPENFPNLKEHYIKRQVVDRYPTHANPNRLTPRHTEKNKPKSSES